MGTESLDDWEQLSEEQREALVDLADTHVDGTVSRRDALKAGGVSALALLGLSSSATAMPASTSDADGDIGTPTSRVDVFADGVDTNSVGADHTWLGQQSDAPTDSEIGSGNVALYAKTDGNLYTKPYGGTETQVGSGSGSGDISVSEDGTQVLAATSDLNFLGVSVTDDGDGTVTIGNTFDMGTL